MISKINKNIFLWRILAFISLVAAFVGVLNPNIYDGVLSPKVMPGTIAQDLSTIVLSIIMLIFTIKMDKKDYKKQIVILGIIGYLFYAYGIYVIERVYNMLYFLYMAIFSLSFYSLVYGTVNISKEIIQKVKLSKLIKNICVVFLLIIPIMFYTLWINMLIPLIKIGQKIEFFYSIYILDLCFIMPAFIILSIMVIKNKGFGLLLIPSLFILGFSILLPVGLGEFLKPYYQLSIDKTGMILYLSLSLLFLILAVLSLLKLKIDEN